MQGNLVVNEIARPGVGTYMSDMQNVRVIFVTSIPNDPFLVVCCY